MKEVIKFLRRQLIDDISRRLDEILPDADDGETMYISPVPECGYHPVCAAGVGYEKSYNLETGKVQTVVVVQLCEYDVDLEEMLEDQNLGWVYVYPDRDVDDVPVMSTDWLYRLREELHKTKPVQA